DCISLDSRLLLPVSSDINGAFGIRGFSIRVPTVVGRAGALQHIELELWPKELQALQASAHALNNTRAKIS
ncbi:MAG: lactate dehydrogenase, partial [Spartobacteria bacterium]